MIHFDHTEEHWWMTNHVWNCNCLRLFLILHWFLEFTCWNRLWSGNIETFSQACEILESRLSNKNEVSIKLRGREPIMIIMAVMGKTNQLAAQQIYCDWNEINAFNEQTNSYKFRKSEYIYDSDALSILKRFREMHQDY